MGIIEDIFAIRKKWNSAGWKERGLIIFILASTIIWLIFRSIIDADNAYSIILKWSVAEKVNIFLGDRMANLYFLKDNLLLTISFIVFFIFCLSFAYKLEKERQKLESEKTKLKDSKREFIEFVEFVLKKGAIWKHL